MRIAYAHAKVPPQAGFSRFDDAHTETSDPAGAAGLVRLKVYLVRRVEVPSRHTLSGL
jgi:hypothetical protein